MRKIGFFLFMLIFAPPVFAQASKAILCPAQVVCTANDKGKVDCTFETDTPEYWDKDTIRDGSTFPGESPAAGVYTFDSAFAGLHALIMKTILFQHNVLIEEVTP